MPSRGGLVGWLSRVSGVSRQAVSGKLRRTAYTLNRGALAWAVDQYQNWKQEGLNVTEMMTRFRQFDGWKMVYLLHGASMRRTVFADHQVGDLGVIWLLAMWKEHAEAGNIPGLARAWDTIKEMDV